MLAWHTWDKFPEKKAAVRTHARQEVIDVAHGLQFPDSYIIVKVISEPWILIL